MTPSLGEDLGPWTMGDPTSGAGPRRLALGPNTDRSVDPRDHRHSEPARPASNPLPPAQIAGKPARPSSRHHAPCATHPGDRGPANVPARGPGWPPRPVPTTGPL